MKGLLPSTAEGRAIGIDVEQLVASRALIAAQFAGGPEARGTTDSNHDRPIEPSRSIATVGSISVGATL
jgi:hypothetical protein